jgi:hypothetical protein
MVSRAPTFQSHSTHHRAAPNWRCVASCVSCLFKIAPQAEVRQPVAPLLPILVGIVGRDRFTSSHFPPVHHLVHPIAMEGFE